MAKSAALALLAFAKDANAKCVDAKKGTWLDECSGNMDWAMHVGFGLHSAWYEKYGIKGDSQLADFQCVLWQLPDERARHGCTRPCSSVLDACQDPKAKAAEESTTDPLKPKVEVTNAPTAAPAPQSDWFSQEVIGIETWHLLLIVMGLVMIIGATVSTCISSSKSKRSRQSTVGGVPVRTLQASEGSEDS